MDDDVQLISAHAAERAAGAVACARLPGKGRALLAARSFSEGEVILTEEPLNIVHEARDDEAFVRLSEMCEENGFDHSALWYWCALRSLTAAEAGPGRAWEPLDAQRQGQLLLLHRGEVTDPSGAVLRVHAEFAPALTDTLQLERLLQAWVHNAFAVLGAAPTYESGHALFFLPSFISHSCLPNAIWYLTVDGSFVLVARRAVAAGDEVTLSYLSEAELLGPAPARPICTTRTAAREARGCRAGAVLRLRAKRGLLARRDAAAEMTSVPLSPRNSQPTRKSSTNSAEECQTRNSSAASAPRPQG